MNLIGKRLTAFLCVIALSVTFAASALAFRAEVYTDKMKVYSRQNTAAKYEIGSLKKGIKFEVVSYSGDWAKISYNGKTGYARISDMKSHQKTKMYVSKKTYVYKKASSSSAKMATVDVNTLVYMVGWSGSYYLCDNGSGTLGYILKSALSKSYVTRTVYANTDCVIYRYASTSSALKSINTNDRLTVTGESGNYYKVKTADGKTTGYIPKSKTSSSKVTVKKEKAYAKEDVTVYKKASSSGGTMGTIKVNTVVYIIGESGSYYKVLDSTQKHTGYILKTKISKTKVTVRKDKAYAREKVTMYKNASSSSGSVMTVDVNTLVYITGESGSYYKVTDSTGKKTGYILKTKLSDTKVAVRMDKAYTNCECTVYKKASTSGGSYGKVKINTVVYITGESGSYYKVLDSTKKNTGYIPKSKVSATKTTVTEQTPTSGRGTYSSSTSTTTMPANLKSTQSTASTSLSNQQKIEYAIWFAQDKLGCYYSSKPNNTTTFDCLTLIYYGYSRVGVRIPNSAYNCGYTGNFETITNTSKLKRGDVVCFDTNQTDGDLSDHVGIYLGSGRFIHASSGAGMVIVSRMDTGYYKEHFYVGRRILN